MAQIEIKTAVIAFCNASGTIVTAFAHRITPDTIPDGQTYPHARIRQIGTDQRYHSQAEGARKHLLQIDVYDDDVAGADANAKILRDAFSGYQGQMGTITTGQVKARITLSNNNPDTKSFWRVIEVEIPTND